MSRRIDERVEIGRVHLKVSDLERAIAFYSGVLGFQVQQRWGSSGVLLGVGGHQQIGLNTQEGLGGTAPNPATTDHYQFAIRYPDRAALGDAVRRLNAASMGIERASDHGISEAIYLRDPDGNSLELYRDRPKEEWPRDPDGAFQMISAPIDLEALIRDAAVANGPAPAAATLLSDPTRAHLKELRTQLLHLHKVLLDDAKSAYELDRGRIGNNAQLLQLVISDPWFSWLHLLSGLIVRIDESIVKDAPTTEADASTIVEEAERLLTASEAGADFQKRYYEALQRQPAVVLAHADVRRTLKSARRS